MSMPLCSKTMKFQKVPGLFLATSLVAHVFLAAVRQKLTFRESLVLSNGCQLKVGVVAGEVSGHF